MNIDLVIALLLLIIAFLYSSVGHGGASGYLAILTLFNIPLEIYKPVVLILNIIIAGIAFVQFFRAGYFRWSICWPLLITSIPCAYLGSQYAANDHLYKILLGIALILPAIRLIGWSPKERTDKRNLSILLALAIGALIGFISGFLNIGGGIFLSPVLILLACCNVKEAAAISSLFIVCNSSAGLVAVNFIGFNFTPSIYSWIFAAIAGGLLGSYLGSRKFKLLTVRYLLAGVMSIASVKLIFFS